MSSDIRSMNESFSKRFGEMLAPTFAKQNEVIKKAQAGSRFTRYLKESSEMEEEISRKGKKADAFANGATKVASIVNLYTTSKDSMHYAIIKGYEKYSLYLDASPDVEFPQYLRAKTVIKTSYTSEQEALKALQSYVTGGKLEVDSSTLKTWQEAAEKATKEEEDKKAADIERQAQANRDTVKEQLTKLANDLVGRADVEVKVEKTDVYYYTVTFTKNTPSSPELADAFLQLFQNSYVSCRRFGRGQITHVLVRNDDNLKKFLQRGVSAGAIEAARDVGNVNGLSGENKDAAADQQTQQINSSYRRPRAYRELTLSERLLRDDSRSQAHQSNKMCKLAEATQKDYAKLGKAYNAICKAFKDEVKCDISNDELHVTYWRGSPHFYSMRERICSIAHDCGLTCCMDFNFDGCYSLDFKVGSSR